MKISFSPPDITSAEADEVREALLSCWITTGPRTKELEKQIVGYCNTEKAVCLNSATACMEGILRLLGVCPGDEVILVCINIKLLRALLAMLEQMWFWQMSHMLLAFLKMAAICLIQFKRYPAMLAR